ncbi:MAG: nickel-dependent lactate racemase [Anaerolineales bacterium]|nr:nickel-dependent lactate racemase [Anaerolineales bacterium]
MRYQIPYGRGQLTFQLPDGLAVDWIAPREAAGAADPLAAVAAALDAPVDGAGLAAHAGARSAAVAINDKTRPVPLAHLLPPLLSRLEALGLPAAAITLLIATGTHQPMPPEEFPAVVPAGPLGRYRVRSHDCDAPDLVDLGVTERGTRVQVNRAFHEADLRIVVGNIEPHQFAGFSGGVKTAAIGLGGRAGINANHALLLDPRSQLGEYDENPLRQDIEAMGDRQGVHLALNAVLNNRKEIVHVLCGRPRAVMRAGVPLARQVCQVPAAGPYDLLIVAPGGHPKDIIVYQSQKAFGHASLIARPGGTVLVAAACPEGSGSARHEAWMRQAPRDYAGVLERFRLSPFQLGPHKGFQIARDASRVRLGWFSEMPAELAELLLLNPIADFQAAVDEAVAALPPAGRVAILPMANATIPRLAG